MTRDQRSGTWLAAAGLVLLIFATIPALGQVLPAWERTVFAAINGITDVPIVTLVARIFSDFVWALVFTAIAVFLFWKGKRLWGWQAGALIGASYVGAAVIEHIVQRARPDALLPANELILRAQQDGYGYPSGHEAAIVVVVLFFWRYLTWPLRILGVVLVLGVGWSRVYLGVHFPLDIVGGIAVGALVAGIVFMLPESWRRAFRMQDLRAKLQNKPQK